ncbi:MAG: hypothetical protein K0R63_231 [Rickettsiales bacterium]|jgi:hypothetical protein|nr:hypothetical protein [Rickettsiales bacterium]
MYPTITAPYVQTAPPTLNVTSIATHEPAVGRIAASVVPPPVASTPEQNDAKRPKQNAKEMDYQRATQRASAAFITQLITGGNKEVAPMTEYGFIRPLIGAPNSKSSSGLSKDTLDILDDQETSFASPEGEEAIPGSAAVAFSHLLETMGTERPSAHAITTISQQNEPSLYHTHATSAYGEAMTRITLTQDSKPQHVKDGA